MALTANEVELIYKLAEEMTGTSQQGSFRKEILVTNVLRRMGALKTSSLHDYLQVVKSNKNEKEQFISALTIHTTSWFREFPHFTLIEKHVRQKVAVGEKKFKIWSAACATGKEPYSVALFLEHLKSTGLEFEYDVWASDIDEESVATGKRAVYSWQEIKEIPSEYRLFLLKGTGPAEGYFAMDKLIRKKVHFFRHSLVKNLNSEYNNFFDIVICRNVLIYFSSEKVLNIVRQLTQNLKDSGMLILGHSEALPITPQGLNSMGHATYTKMNKVHHQANGILSKKKILVVDDSKTVRTIIRKIFEGSNCDVTDCESAEAASHEIEFKKFDLITLDLNMPGENGLQWLKKQRAQSMKTPTVIVSDSSPQDAETVFGALESGAQDYLIKQDLFENPQKLVEILNSLSPQPANGFSVSMVTNSIVPFNKKNFQPELILIGASTGGPEAIKKLLGQFRTPCPPVVLVQHITTEFARPFALRMSSASGLKLDVIEDGKPLKNNHLYIAEGDYHIELFKKNNELCIFKNSSSKKNGHRPSVDNLFLSAVELNIASMAVLLTGMGADGAKGLAELQKTQNCYCLVQDEKSCIVFGMPKQAIELGAANFIGTPEEIRAEIIGCLEFFRQSMTKGHVTSA